MTTPVSAPRHFYVYEHWRPDKDVCFYVGKGRGKRANVMSERSAHHGNIQAKLARQGMCVEVRLVREALTEAEAFAFEIKRIAFWRGVGVKLANKSSGGEGPSGVPCSDERKRAMSALMKGRVFTDAHRAKLSASGIGKHSNVDWTPERRAKLSAALKGKPKTKKRPPITEETRAKLSTARKGKPRPPEVMEKLFAALRGRKLSEETKAKISASRMGHKSGPLSDGHKAKISAAHRGRKFTAEHRAAISNAARNRRKKANA